MSPTPPRPVQRNASLVMQARAAHVDEPKIFWLPLDEPLIRRGLQLIAEARARLDGDPTFRNMSFQARTGFFKAIEPDWEPHFEDLFEQDLYRCMSLDGWDHSADLGADFMHAEGGSIWFAGVEDDSYTWESEGVAPSELRAALLYVVEPERVGELLRTELAEMSTYLVLQAVEDGFWPRRPGEPRSAEPRARLSQEDLVPLLTHQDPEVRQRTILAMSSISSTETPARLQGGRTQ